ncbi:uncharacterized protein LOC100373376 [Saccoglossus kowalevskii]
MDRINGITNATRRLSSVSLGHRSPLKEKQQTVVEEEEQIKYNILVKKSKQKALDGLASESLALLQQAAKIYDNEKIQRRIRKLEEYIKEYGDEESEEEDDGMALVGDGFSIRKELYEKLYPYQRESILWFWGLHKKKSGGILGDDMGLGKTIQVIAFLSGLFDAERVKSILIVLPATLIINWEREFDKWAPGIRVLTYHGSNKRERERALSKVQRRGGALLSTYGIISNNWQEVATNDRDGRDFVWDYVILDEGHKIKNKSNKSSKAVHAIPAKRRIILTGTPIQNNLKELWALFDFVTQGQLLGTLKTFCLEYEGPIVRARQKDARPSEMRLGTEMAENLRQIIEPYFKRRTKAETLEKNKENQTKDDTREEMDGNTTASSTSTPTPSLTRKNDLILWVFLSKVQQKIYQDFVETPEVRQLLMTTRSPLAMLTMLKKICDHPRLLNKRACGMLNLEGEECDPYGDYSDTASQISSSECAADNIDNVSISALVEESGKLVVLISLLENLRDEGHRTLVFSQSKKMLDIMQKVLEEKNFKLIRIDGSIRKLEDREKLINKFQRNSSYSVFLLTTGVGGIGLTLTAADRVVIFDPSWNPATDSQAVDRAYRLGQKKTVVIYRLITCGSVEEKIYRRQIFKDSITKQATGSSKDPYRYFTRLDMKELFKLDDPTVSTTQIQLEQLHSAKRKTDTSLDMHIAYLYSLAIFGISDHDLMFSEEAEECDESEDEVVGDYVQQKVRRAQELLSNESDLTRQYNERIKNGTEPAPKNDPMEHQYKPTRAPGKSWSPKTVDLTRTNDVVDLRDDSGEDSDVVDLDQSVSNLALHDPPSQEQGSSSSSSSNNSEFHTVDDIQEDSDDDSEHDLDKLGRETDADETLPDVLNNSRSESLRNPEDLGSRPASGMTSKMMIGDRDFETPDIVIDQTCLDGNSFKSPTPAGDAIVEDDLNESIINTCRKKKRNAAFISDDEEEASFEANELESDRDSVKTDYHNDVEAMDTADDGVLASLSHDSIEKDSHDITNGQNTRISVGKGKDSLSESVRSDTAVADLEQEVEGGVSGDNETSFVEVDSKHCQASFESRASMDGKDSDSNNVSTEESSDPDESLSPVEVDTKESQVDFPSPVCSDDEERKMEAILSESVHNVFSSDDENVSTPLNRSKLGLRTASSTKRRRSSIRMVSLVLDSDEDLPEKECRGFNQLIRQDIMSLTESPIVAHSKSKDSMLVDSSDGAFVAETPESSPYKETRTPENQFHNILSETDEEENGKDDSLASDIEQSDNVVDLTVSSNDASGNLAVEESDVPDEGEEEEDDDEEKEAEGDEEENGDVEEEDVLGEEDNTNEEGVTDEEDVADKGDEEEDEDVEEDVEEEEDVLDEEDNTDEGVTDEGVTDEEGVADEEQVDVTDEDFANEEDEDFSDEDENHRDKHFDEPCGEDNTSGESFQSAQENVSDKEVVDEDLSSEEEISRAKRTKKVHVLEESSDEDEDEEDGSLENSNVQDASMEEVNNVATSSSEDEDMEAESAVDEREQAYEKLVKDGRSFEKDGNVQSALKCYLKALDINSQDKNLQKKTVQLYEKYKYHSNQGKK